MENNLKNLEVKMELVLQVLTGLRKPDANIKPKYYRNKDLKVLFGLSSNTIIKYREQEILPFTLLGEIYLYPVDEVQKILKQNASY